MRLSPAAELAVRGSLALASKYGQGPVTLETVCSTRDLPRQYLVKILSSLGKAGLVTSVRGKHGGYLLTRDPKQISLLEIIEAIEGPMTLNYCLYDPPRCEEFDCPIRPLWADLQKTVCTKLAGMKLGDCTGL